MLYSVGSETLGANSTSLNTSHKMEALGAELRAGLRSLIITGDDGSTQCNLKEERRSDPSREPHYMTLS